jgi:hypothetical protein
MLNKVMKKSKKIPLYKKKKGRKIADLEGTHERLIDTHHAARVVKLPAVVGRGEECHQLTLGEELVAVLHHLFHTCRLGSGPERRGEWRCGRVQVVWDGGLEAVLRIRIRDLGSGAFLTPGSGIRNKFFQDPGSRIPDPKPIFLRAW